MSVVVTSAVKDRRYFRDLEKTADVSTKPRKALATDL